MNLTNMHHLLDMLNAMKRDAVKDENSNPLRFNMADFAEREEPYCGTSCCIAGSMAYYKPFQEQGLGCKISEWSVISGANIRPTLYGGVQPAWSETCGDMLGLSEWQSARLFISPHYPSGVCNDGEMIPLKDITIDQAITRVERCMADPIDFCP